jgi:hypothetical protein
VPIALADACLIRLAELTSGSALLTLDSDFRIYRLHGPSHHPRHSAAGHLTVAARLLTSSMAGR